MATRGIGSIGDDGAGNPLVAWSIEIDNSGRVTALVCVNSTQQAAWGSITQISNGRTAGARFPPGATNVPISTGQSQRILAAFDERGRLVDFTMDLLWPYP